ncbi:MAG: hypothetical protein SFU53_01005 [Terrimicrobiaceae bacterium]|nr:hypothetical protein [Terrimicrobiaceae bacterium]
MRSFALGMGWILVVLFLSAAAFGQALNDGAVEGVLFYKDQAFSDEASAAWPFEYRSVASNEKISMVVTREGRRMRLRSDQILLAIPYPGRGDLTQEEAMRLCDLASARFPQHRQLISNIRTGWQKVMPEDYQRHAHVSAVRRGLADQLIVRMQEEARRVGEMVAKLVRGDAKPSPAPQVAETQPGGDPLDYRQNLKIIEDYYQKAGEMGAEPSD